MGTSRQVFRLLRFDYFPPFFDPPFAPLSTARCSDAETFSGSNPRAVGTISQVSPTPTHTCEARGLMRVSWSLVARRRGDEKQI